MKIFRSHSNNLDFKKIKNLFLLLLSLLAINGLRADTFIVSNTDDSGAGSLRQAILDANANPGADVITFDIDGGGAQSITVSSALPTISGALTVDGTTQPGYSGSPLIAVGADFSSTIFYAENAGSVALTALDVSKNGTAAGIAFQMQNLSSLSVTNCWAKNRTYGLYINQCSGITATGNDLTDCGVSGGWAIFLGSSNGTNMDISNNAIAGATTNGLWLYYCSNVSVAPSNAAVEVGNLLKPLTTPLNVEGGSNNSVSGLDLEKTGAVGGGINFTSVNGLTVTNNIFKNRIHGLYINQCSGITATGNDLTDCGVSGGWAIFLGSSNGTNMDVSNNTIAGATTNGLWLYYCSNVSVAPSNAAVEVGNLLKPLTSPLNVEGGSNNSVSGLDLEKTGAVGGSINFTSVNGLTVTGCTLKNRSTGLFFNSCATVSATCNLLENCTNGIQSYYCAAPVFTNNTFYNNTLGITQNGGAAVNAQSNFWAFNTPLENQPNGYSGSVDVSNPLASAAGCAPVLVVPSEISILGNNLEILNGDVSPATNDGTDFGSIYTTGQTATHTFSISNTGIGQLVLDGAALSGTGASHFSLENLTYPTSVAPNGSLEIDVTFDPSATGLQVATLTFENNDSDEDPYSFDIQGIGLACSPTLPSGTVFRWTNGGGDGLWSNANNWLNSSNLPTVPTAGSVAFFSCLGSADATLDVNTSIGSLVFDANYGNTLHLGGQILTLTSALVVPNASQLDAGTGLVKMSNTTINCAANLNNAEFVSGDFYLLQNLNVLNDLTITSINALQGTVANLKILVGGDVVSDDTNGFGNCCGYQPVFVSLTSGSDQNLSGTGVFTFLDISKTGGNVLMLNDITVHFGTLTGTSTAHFVGSGGILKFNHSSINFAGDVDNVQFVANDFYLYQNLKVLNDLTITSINALQGTAANLKILVGGDVISNDANGFANCCGYQPVFLALNGSTDQNISGTGVLTFVEFAKTGGNALFGSFNKTFNTAKVTAGTWNLLGNTFSSAGGFSASTGGAIAGSGTLTGNVNIGSASFLSPDCINITGTLVMASGSHFVANISGSTVCTGFDQVNVSGSATLTGSILDLSASVAGSGFKILDAASLSGTFTTTNFPVGCGWSILYNNPATGEVSVSSGADATPPTAVCQNITKNLDATSSATVVAGEINNGSTDNCTSAILAIVNGQTTFSCADIGQNHVLTLRATDAAGNSATCLATVTIAAYPNALPFDISVFGNSLEISSGDATPATADGTDFGAVAIGGSLVRTFSIQNTGSAALPINSILSSNPSKFAVSGVPGSVAPGGSANFTVTFSPTATGIENATITVNSLDCDEMNYNFSVAGEAACSNPVFTICPENQSANTASNSCDAVVSYSATASDPITGYSFSGATTGSGSGTGSGATFNKGVTSVVLTATNDCGTTTCAFTVTVSDIQPPVVTCPAPVTINMTEGQCSGTTTLTSPTVTDNCPVNTVLGNALDFDGANDIVNLPTTSMPSGNVDHTVECWTYFKSGQTEPKVILWYGTSLGNQQAVYIVDPTNGNKISVNHGSAGNAGVFNTAMPLNTWTHLAFVYHGSTNSIDLYLNGAFQQTLTYNAALNLPTTTFQFGALYSTNFRAGMKLDEVRIWNLARSAAQIQASKDVELGGSETGLVRYFKFNQGTAGGDNNGLTALAATTGVGGTLVNFALSGSVSNWVSGAPGTIAATNNAPATFPKGQTVVTWTATDASNNTATCSQTVTVVDNLAPSITCAAPVSINTTTGLCTGTTVLTNPTVVDNCTIPSTGNSLKFDGTNDVVVLDDNLKNALNGGTAITVEYWFKGTNIQSAFRFQDISNAFVVAGWAGSSTPKHIISVDGGTAGVSIGNSVLDGNWHHIAMTWQKNTVNGFKSYVDGVIVDQRNSANANLPVVSQRPTLGGYFVAGASQEYMNGSLEEVRIWNTARTQAQIQAVMRSELVGNEANLLAYYNFNQGTAGGNNAGVTALPDLATGLAGTNTGNLTNFALNGQTSNWLNQPINLANNAPAVFPKGNTTVTWTGKDASGNSATCSQTVTVTDNQAPVLTCGANLTVSPTAGGNCEVKLVLNSPLISDNCTPFLENNLSFDASNDRVTIPSTADFNFGTANFTIEMWVKTSGTAFQVFADKRINSSAGTWWRTGLSGGKYWFEISAAQNCQTTKLFNDGYWHHVAFVRNGTSPAIFVDGVSVPVTIAGAWDANVSNTADVGAGLFLGNACCGLKGQMDELRIWKSARTQFEILANKNITLTGSEANLLAYYNFNQGTPGGSNPTVTTLTDLATAIGGANNGTLTNFALTGNISNWVGGGPISLATSNAPAAFPVGNSTVTWSITDSDGNTGTCNQTVTAVPSNLATSHSVTNVTCFGGANGTVFTTNTGGLAPFSYLWNIAKTTANINLLVAATYNLTTTDAAGCSKTSSAAVGEAPAINFAVGLTSNGTNPPTFNAVFTTTGGTPGYLYNRTGMAATLYLPATDPIFQNLAANATFIFKVKDANGCNKSVVKKTPATTPPPPSGNVAERFLENEKANDASGEAIGMAVFPNPTSDFLNVEFLSEGKTNGQISVFDMLGKVVFSKNVDFEEEAIFQVPVQNLSAGGYVLIFRDDFGKIISNRFIVERN